MKTINLLRRVVSVTVVRRKNITDYSPHRYNKPLSQRKTIGIVGDAEHTHTQRKVVRNNVRAGVRFTFQKRASLSTRCLYCRFQDILAPKVAMLGTPRFLYIKKPQRTTAHVLLAANL